MFMIALYTTRAQIIRQKCFNCLEGSCEPKQYVVGGVFTLLVCERACITLYSDCSFNCCLSMLAKVQCLDNQCTLVKLGFGKNEH